MHPIPGFIDDPRLELAKLKQIVADIDPKASFTIMAAQEVHGGTFKAPIH